MLIHARKKNRADIPRNCFNSLVSLLDFAMGVNRQLEEGPDASSEHQLPIFLAEKTLETCRAAPKDGDMVAPLR